ncbi:hypothetical protein HYC85_028578 [Camellia sinensis]|uniref:Chromo domain-containing protein n=1 Tax=Camellia sinensis TaxID=4442 RepID=A0A7J7FWA4_CAMSI|nr:hypothetical protein HYC85_028578 [Camellia sinensis]
MSRPAPCTQGLSIVMTNQTSRTKDSPLERTNGRLNGQATSTAFLLFASGGIALRPRWIREDFSYEETLVQILDSKEKMLHTKAIKLVKILWHNHLVEEATWEREDEMREKAHMLVIGSDDIACMLICGSDDIACMLICWHLINAVSNRDSSNASGLSLSGNEIRRGRGRRGGRGRQEMPLPEEVPAVQEGVGQANVVEPAGQ